MLGLGRTKKGPRIVYVPEDEALDGVIRRIKRSGGSTPVIAFVGWAKEADGAKETERIVRRRQLDQIEQLLQRDVAPFIGELGAEKSPTIVTGGTDFGVMRVVGRVFSECAPTCTLVGVAPADSVNRSTPAEPHHDVLVLGPGAGFRSELTILGGLMERMSHGGVLMVVAGGGGGTRDEVELAERRGWPVLALEGTGGVADELARKAKRSLSDTRRCARWQKIDGTRSGLSSPTLVSPDGRVAVVPVDRPAAVCRLIGWAIGDSNIRAAWARAGYLDDRAQRAKPRTVRLRHLTFFAAVATTLFSVMAATFDSGLPYESLTVAAAVTAALGAGVLGWTSRRGRDKRWLALRSASEQLQRVIYRYRGQGGPYAGDIARRRLFESIAEIETELAATAPDSIGTATPTLWPTKQTWCLIPESDRAFGRLSASDYLTSRVRTQIDYFDGATSKADQRANRLTLIILLLALLSTIVALAVTSTWVSAVAVIAAVQAAIASALAYDQTEQRVQLMSSAAAGLRRVEMAWEAKPPTSDGPAKLVDGCERILEVENNDWMRGLSVARDILDSFGGSR